MIETRYKNSVDPVRTDGRDIDPKVGTLSGEASGQLSGPVDTHLKDIAEPWKTIPMPDGSDPTYYDRPMLKEPVWEWDIPLYYYIGGTAGASLVLGAACQLDGGRDLDDVVRRCHWTGIIGSTLGGVLLIYDLGRPSRFLHMMRVFRPTSPMSMGAWILSGAAPTAITAGLFMRRPGFWGTLGEAFGYASGLFGMGLASYTGVLLGNTAVPLWQQSSRVLPVLFVGSAMASAGSIFDVMFEHPRARRITRTFGMVGRVAELTAGLVMEYKPSNVPRVTKPLKSGASGVLWKAATVLTAGSLVTMMLPKQTKKKRIAAGVLGTLGSLTMRYAVHHAGVASARDAKASFHQQRAKGTGSQEEALTMAV